MSHIDKTRIFRIFSLIIALKLIIYKWRLKSPFVNKTKLSSTKGGNCCIVTRDKRVSSVCVYIYICVCKLSCKIHGLSWWSFICNCKWIRFIVHERSLMVSIRHYIDNRAMKLGGGTKEETCVRVCVRQRQKKRRARFEEITGAGSLERCNTVRTHRRRWLPFAPVYWHWHRRAALFPPFARPSIGQRSRVSSHRRSQY